MFKWLRNRKQRRREEQKQRIMALQNSSAVSLTLDEISGFTGLDFNTTCKLCGELMMEGKLHYRARNVQ